MKHSNQIREFMLTDKGINLIDVYTGLDGVLTGSARVAQEIRNNEENRLLHQEIDHMKRTIEQQRKSMQSRIEAIKAEFETEQEEVLKKINIGNQKIERLNKVKKSMSESRTGKKTGKAK